MSYFNSSRETVSLNSTEYLNNSRHLDINSETTLDILEDTKVDMTTSIPLKEQNINEYKNMNYSEYVKNATIYESQIVDNSFSKEESKTNINYKKSVKDNTQNTSISINKSSNNEVLESIKKYSPYAIIALIGVGISTIIYKKITQNSK